MKQFFLVLLCCCGLRPAAEAQLFSLDNPLIKAGIQNFIEPMLSELVGKETKIGDLKFWKIKHGKGFYKIRGIILPDNKATNWITGKGDTRFKLKVGDSLFPPKFYWLRIHIPRLRFLGIRFYMQVFPAR